MVKYLRMWKLFCTFEVSKIERNIDEKGSLTLLHRGVLPKHRYKIIDKRYEDNKPGAG